ncbi:hypothetical protein D3C72_2464790 [compost metagenome]
MNQSRADADQDGAEQDDADNAPEQHAMLIEPGDAEEAEDRGYDEHVVHGQ